VRTGGEIKGMKIEIKAITYWTRDSIATYRIYGEYFTSYSAKEIRWVNF
jgi:hypothetical protein